MTRTPFRPREPRQQRRRATAKPFPQRVAALLDARDSWCAFCGTPFNLHRHHRRLKGAGGDPRPHAQCSCNGVLLCAAHHAWIHDTAEGRREAEHDGLIIPRSTLEPWTVGVLVRTADGGLLQYPGCDGLWHDAAPMGAAA
jgi:hypothetical protein